MSERLMVSLAVLVLGVVAGISGVSWLVASGSDDVAGSAESTDADGASSAPEGGGAPASPDRSRPDAADASDNARAAGRPAPEPEPATPPPPEELVAHLQAALDSADVQAVEDLSVVIVDEGGRELVALDARQPVMPASTTKMVTAAAALRTLGPDFRYTTRAVASGPITDGRLEGDLVVVGAGDPTLASPDYIESVYPARPHTPVTELADEIVDAGITEITGAIRGDGGLFADEPVAAGWLDRYFSSLDATRVAGLTVDAGRRLLDRDGTLHAEVAEEPEVLAAEVLDGLLAERDVAVGEDPGRGEARPDADEVAEVQSPPLGALLTHVMQASDNHMADGIFRTLGTLDGDGTWQDSDEAAREALTDLNLPWPGVVLADGSGLSREARLSAQLLAHLDRKMTASLGSDWEALLAVAGERGTLQGRLHGTPAEGRLIAKTGALRDARALAGHVESPDGPRYHFAILGGELDDAGIQSVRALMDEISLLLAGDVPDCMPEELDEDGACPVTEDPDAEEPLDEPEPSEDADEQEPDEEEASALDGPAEHVAAASV